MALTKIGSIGINTGIAFAGVTTIATLNGSDSVLSVGGTVNFVSDVSIGGTVSIAGTLTYEDVTNVDAVGLITARDGIKVGSGITLSKDGDIFFTGIITGNGSGLTNLATDLVNDTTPQLGGDLASNGNDINVAANDRVVFGTDKLRVKHTDSNADIENTTGNIVIKNDSSSTSEQIILQAKGGEDSIKAVADGAVELYHNNSKKLETDSSGVTVTGRVAATSYTGDGSSLTGISVGIATTASQVSGITTVIDLNKDDIRLDCTGLVTIDTKGGTEGNNHVLRIVNSGVSTVTFNSYFKFPSGASPALPTASGAISLISFTVHTQGRVGVASVFLAGASVNFS